MGGSNPVRVVQCSPGDSSLGYGAIALFLDFGQEGNVLMVGNPPFAKLL
jgi:hypothetical protein